MSVLLGLLSSPRVLLALGAAAVALGLGGYVWHLRSANASLTASNATLTYQLDEAQRIATQNADELARYKAESARAMAAVVADRDAARKRADSLAAIKKETARAEDGPLAPALRDTLRRLRERSPAPDPAATSGAPRPAVRAPRLRRRARDPRPRRRDTARGGRLSGGPDGGVRGLPREARGG